jgi:hypothetical protein
MAFSLYDATVANYLQILDAVGSFLDKGLTHLRNEGIDPAEIVETRLAPDAAIPFPDRHGRAPFARCNGKPRGTECALRRRIDPTSITPHFRQW